MVNVTVSSMVKQGAKPPANGRHYRTYTPNIIDQLRQDRLRSSFICMPGRTAG